MKKIAFIESPYVKYDPSLDDEEKKNPNPFPEKMAATVAFIEQHGLPPEVKRTKKWKKKHKEPSLSALQTELLTVFAIEPSVKQMQQLKDFLHQLFGEQLHKEKAEAKQEIVIVA
jgi:hypothetical protein